MMKESDESAKTKIKLELRKRVAGLFKKETDSVKSLHQITIYLTICIDLYSLFR